jgi:hypothetical protein
MSLPSRRCLAEARIALGSVDRFLLLYTTMFAAFGVASPFLPALLHQRGLDPSKIGAVLAAGTAIRLKNPLSPLTSARESILCFRRDYSAEHLIQHPVQPTGSVLLAFQEQGLVS